MVEMSDRFPSDACLLVPCKVDLNKSKDFRHSVTGYFEIENSPLRINTLLFIGTKRKLKNYLKLKEGIEIKDNAAFEETFKGASGLTFPCTNINGASFVVVWMPKFEWSLMDIETLSHECIHASVMVMRMSGERPKIFSTRNETDVDDEGLAYRQSSMFVSMLKKLAKKQQRMYRSADKSRKRSSKSAV